MLGQQLVDGLVAPEGVVGGMLDELVPEAELIHAARARGDSLLFEGAQGALLDIDHGTYPYVTSSNCIAGAAATGSGIGPRMLDYVLGIVKAYTTRVGTGPFPTELTDDTGATLGRRGNEFGSVTGRPRRCGWIDVPALRRSFELGEIDILALSTGRERFLRIQSDALGAQQDYFVALAGLERVVGVDLWRDDHHEESTP